MSRDVRLIRSPISIAGMVLTTLSAVVFIVVLLGDLFGLHTNPYLGILFFIALPALFVLGLLLIPLGAWIEHRRRAAGRPPTSIDWPRIDLNDPAQRATAIAVFSLTMVNVVIVSLGAYKAVEYMDSVAFCGQVCHTPMKPQLTAHQQGPHAGVACVACHIGEGPSEFLKAKLAGTRQLIGVTTGRYPRPIFAAPGDIVAADDTCERCHAPGRFHGDITRRVTDYASDERNTPTVTTLQIHVGGGNRAALAKGIHWHAVNVVEYIATDDRRQTIPWVRVMDGDRTVREYAAAGATPEKLTTGIRRRMDCTDCHNRQGHAIAATPERAVDMAIASGDIPVSLPFARREALKALSATYGSEQSAVEGISRSLRDFYEAGSAQATDGRGAEIDRAVLSVQNIYRRSVFPDMNVTFGTYGNNLGHVDTPGCFRCHDDEHVSRDGKRIGQDCETCHAIE